MFKLFAINLLYSHLLTGVFFFHKIFQRKKGLDVSLWMTLRMVNVLQTTE